VAGCSDRIGGLDGYPARGGRGGRPLQDSQQIGRQDDHLVGKRMIRDPRESRPRRHRNPRGTAQTLQRAGELRDDIRAAADGAARPGGSRVRPTGEPWSRIVGIHDPDRPRAGRPTPDPAIEQIDLARQLRCQVGHPGRLPDDDGRGSCRETPIWGTLVRMVR
jgi:hypothetical protein